MKFVKNIKVAKYRNSDFRKMYYFKKFNSIPYKDYFIFTTAPRLQTSLVGVKFYVYSGNRWFKVDVTSWNTGLSTKFFIWPKRPSIFKLKQKKK